MADESHSFSAAKSRLDEIVTQVRKKDTSLEKSLDLLEEGVRLANICTEQIDQTDWTPADPTQESSAATVAPTGDDVTAGETQGVNTDTAEVAGVETAGVEAGDGDAEGDDVAGEVWSEDEAWADEAQDDPSDGDDGHGA